MDVAVVSSIETIEADDWQEVGLDASVHCVLLRRSDDDDAAIGAAATGGAALVDGAPAVARAAPMDAPTRAARTAASHAFLATLTGACNTLRSSRSDGFSYKVCVGGDVTQLSETQGTYRLGTFDEAATQGAAASAQAYTNGDMCGTTARRASVKFFCVRSGTEEEGQVGLRVLSASEPAVCDYEINVAHPSACAWDKDEGGIDRPLPFPRGQLSDASEEGQISVWAARVRGGALTPARAAILDSLPRAAAQALAKALDGADATGSGGSAAEEDVAAGGGSMGVDDRSRSGRLWTRLAGENEDGEGLSVHQQTWALEASTGWLASTTGGSHSDAASRALRVTCGAFSSDDLRKGGDAAARAAARVDAHIRLGTFALLVLAPKGVAGSAAVSRAVIRGGNRRHVDVDTSASDGAPVLAHGQAVARAGKHDACTALLSSLSLDIRDAVTAVQARAGESSTKLTCVGALVSPGTAAADDYESVSLSLDVTMTRSKHR